MEGRETERDGELRPWRRGSGLDRRGHSIPWQEFDTTMISTIARNRSFQRIVSSACGAVRYLNLHEYQSIGLLRSHGATVQQGTMASNGPEAEAIAREILAKNPAAEIIVKAQIHAGGRGKGVFKNGFKGGVQIVTDAKKVHELADEMIDNVLVTKQTGENGQLCQKVLVNEGISIQDEKYFAILMDRAHNGPVLIGSPKGGMDIEAVAEENPNDIYAIPVDIMTGITDAQCEQMARNLNFSAELIPNAVANMKALYKLFIASDATQVEINPMAVASDNKVYCVDAKLNFDDNAAYRQKDIFAMRDITMEDPRDTQAEAVGLNYIALDGNIGCMVNGAGLAMATMDLIQLHGGKPANFLDVGGGATKNQVAQAFKILVSDSNVKAILVNIFGGIMKCDVIAEGILAAYKEIGVSIPLVVRLEGTNVEIGKKLLQDSGLPIITADNLDDVRKT